MVAAQPEQQYKHASTPTEKRMNKKMRQKLWFTGYVVVLSSDAQRRS
jgi:hypothetical protein